MKADRFKTVTSINGLIVPDSQARISVFDNALLYAEGLFETFLAIDDRVIFIDEHLDRLFGGAAVIGLTVPVNRSTLADWMTTTLQAHPDRIKKLRLTITPGESARWVGVQGSPQVILSASPHTIPEESFRLQVAEWKVDQASAFRQIKTISYAIHAAALLRARQAGFDDALMINQNNDVAEVSSANIYWVRQGRVFTPPLSAGCLEGVTRKTLLTEAANMGITIEEKSAPLTEILKADEIFISSSLKLVVGVSEIAQGTERYLIPPGELTRAFRERFVRKVRY